MKRVCLVNGSLRGEKSSSREFLSDVLTRMNAAEFSTEKISVKAKSHDGYPDETLSIMAYADAVVIAFPLFTYSLPGGLARLLEDFYSYATRGGGHSKNAKVFAIVNCGFPEPGICNEAIRVVRNFCARLGLSYRFSVAIGSGPATVMTRKIPFLNLALKRAFSRIVKDIRGAGSEKMEDMFIKPIIPKGIILKIKEQYEKKMPTLQPNPLGADVGPS